MQTILQVNVGSQGWTGAEKAVNSIRAITLSHANGLASYITGPLGNGADRLRRPAEPGQIAHNPDGGGRQGPPSGRGPQDAGGGRE